MLVIASIFVLAIAGYKAIEEVEKAMEKLKRR
jgi:hypothetical protein